MPSWRFTLTRLRRESALDYAKVILNVETNLDVPGLEYDVKQADSRRTRHGRFGQ